MNINILLESRPNRQCRRPILVGNTSCRQSYERLTSLSILSLLKVTRSHKCSDIQSTHTCFPLKYKVLKLTSVRGSYLTTLVTTPEPFLGLGPTPVRTSNSWPGQRLGGIKLYGQLSSWNNPPTSISTRCKLADYNWSILLRPIWQTLNWSHSITHWYGGGGGQAS